MTTKLFVSIYSPDWRAYTLSNMTPCPMSIDGIEAKCVEGIIQYMNFPEGHSLKAETLLSSGPECKSYMMEAMNIAESAEWAYWLGQKIRRMSDEHKSLMRRIIRAKYASDEGAWEAARLCDGIELGYHAGSNDDTFSIPKTLFLDELGAIISDIRDGLFPCPAKNFVSLNSMIKTNGA